jgi:hypothetical protein
VCRAAPGAGSFERAESLEHVGSVESPLSFTPAATLECATPAPFYRPVHRAAPTVVPVSVSFRRSPVRVGPTRFGDDVGAGAFIHDVSNGGV